MRRLVPLLEREAELEAVAGSLARLAAGTGSLLLIEGPAGVGKTTLLAEAEAASGMAALVRRARGGEIERELPFGVGRQLFEPVIRRCSEEERADLLSGSAALALGAIGRPGTVGEAAGDPLALMHGLYWLVANLAERQPVVLVIDDAHWADAQTLRWVEYLSRRLTDLPVLVLAAARVGEPDEPGELDRLRLEADILRPRPLSEAAVRKMVRAELGEAASQALCAGCWAATGGNPFLLHEVLRGLRADDGGTPDDAIAALARLRPESVARSVLLRLGRFGPHAVSLARAIAVLGGAPQLRHAAALAGLEAGAAHVLCDRLRDAEILKPGLPIDFVHPVVRQAIYGDLGDGHRTRLHRRAAGILAEGGARARDVAPHLMACLPEGDQWVVGQLASAALEAVPAGAYEAAAAYLERALEEPPDDPYPLRHALGRALVQTEPARAAEMLGQLSDEAPDPATKARALRHAAGGYFLAGRWQEAARCYAAVVDLLPRDEREKRLSAEAELYVTSAASLGADEHVSRRIEAVAGGLAGTSPGECLARQALALDRFARGAPVGEVVALASSFPPLRWELTSNLSPGLTKILARCGRWDEARRAITRIADAARQAGLLLPQTYYLGILSDIDRLAGRLADAEAEARTALTLAGDADRFLNPGREAITNLIAALVARGALEEAEQLAGGVDMSAGVRDVHVAPWPIEVRGQLRLARGDLEAGVGDLLEFGDEMEGMGCANPAVSPWRQDAAAALARLGRAEEGRRLIAVAEDRARAFGAAHLIGTVLRAKAVLAPRRRQIELLRESVDALGSYGPPHELARSLLALGGELRRGGHRTEAREPLRRALDLAHRSGAAGVERMARDELRVAGARPRRAFLTGPTALTATEQRIAALAVEGLTNREIAQALFVTRKTIENHLGRIYAKLGISSRDDLDNALKGANWWVGPP